MAEADPLRRLIHAFSKLPGIGEKTATRLAFFALQSEESISRELAQALMDAREKVRLCTRCCNYTEAENCRFCTDARRDDRIICVVESVSGLMAIEATGEFRGRYHVLHGVLSPLDGIGPDEIRLKELVPRLGHGVEEVIVATNPSMGGEVTATYIQKWLCAPLGVRVTRIASGVPIGADLEYADQVTLGRALEGRREL
jgi:recombination protein RecR